MLERLRPRGGGGERLMKAPAASWLSWLKGEEKRGRKRNLGRRKRVGAQLATTGWLALGKQTNDNNPKPQHTQHLSGFSRDLHTLLLTTPSKGTDRFTACLFPSFFFLFVFARHRPPMWALRLQSRRGKKLGIMYIIVVLTKPHKTQI